MPLTISLLCFAQIRASIFPALFYGTVRLKVSTSGCKLTTIGSNIGKLIADLKPYLFYIMKTQLIVRILGPRIPVYDVIAGTIGDDGSFRPCDMTQIHAPFLSSVTLDPLLGTQAYVKSSDLITLFRDIMDVVEDVYFFPDMIIFNLKVKYEQKTETPKKDLGC